MAFVITLVLTTLLLIAATVLCCFEPVSLFIIIPVDVLSFYHLFTSFFGFVELREQTVFVKLGLLTSREIPYEKIRELAKERKLYADSTVSLKCALDHVNIKYNTFDVLSVSVRGNDELIREIEARM